MTQIQFIESIKRILDSAIKENWHIAQILDLSKEAIAEWEEDNDI